MGQLGGLGVDEEGRVNGDWELVAARVGLTTKAELLDHGLTLIAWDDDKLFRGHRPWGLLTTLWATAIEKRLADAGLLA